MSSPDQWSLCVLHWFLESLFLLMCVHIFCVSVAQWWAGVGPWTSFVPFNYTEVEIFIYGKGTGNSPLHPPPSTTPLPRGLLLLALMLDDVQKTDATPWFLSVCTNEALHKAIFQPLLMVVQPDLMCGFMDGAVVSNPSHHPGIYWSPQCDSLHYNPYAGSW